MDRNKLKAIRGNRIMALMKTQKKRRRSVARRFQRQLRVALASAGFSAPTLAQETLIAVAASCFTEHAELARRFLNARLSNKELAHLHQLRSQLCKTLALLGLTDAVSDPEPVGAPKLQDWLEDWRTRQKRASEGEANASGHSEGAA